MLFANALMSPYAAAAAVLFLSWLSYVRYFKKIVEHHKKPLRKLQSAVVR